MSERTLPNEPAPMDRLMSRPDETPLPTKLDPAGPVARGYPADPKPVPPQGQGDPDATQPAPDELGRPT